MSSGLRAADWRSDKVNRGNFLDKVSVMHARMLHVADGFWNIRGSFKVGGVIDVGTQASLVRQASGKFVVLDACSLPDAVVREIDELTDGGKDIEAILNLHPFHTIHVTKVHERYTHAKLYGTARHVSRFPGLPWQDVVTESAQLHAIFADDLEFSVPRGVDFISADESVHFASVLVLHRASKTIHVDDTVMHVGLPGVLRWLGLTGHVSFHPTLAKALEKRAGAAQDFRQWAEALAERWRDAENLCAAHTSELLACDNDGDSVHARLVNALDKAGSTLKTHERKYG